MASGSWTFTPSRDYGGDWGAYFAEYTAQREAHFAGQDEVNAGETVVLSREWLAPDALSKRTKLGKLAQRLVAEGWEVHVGYSTFKEPDRIVKSTGTLKEGKEGELFWLDAAHRPTKRRLTATRDLLMLNGQRITEEEL